MRVIMSLVALAALSLTALPAHATAFTPGEFVTWSEVEWGEDPTPTNISGVLESQFNSVFAPSYLLEVGIPGPTGYSMIFDSADAVIAYLPPGGAPAPLTADLLDPITSASGFLGGTVVADTLNVTFSDAGLLAHPAGVTFGDLVFQHLEGLVSDPEFPGIGPEIAALDGITVREALSDADQVLGGATSPFTPMDLSQLLDLTIRAFNGGGVSNQADTYLALPPSTAIPEPAVWAMLLIGFGALGIVRHRPTDAK